MKFPKLYLSTPDLSQLERAAAIYYNFKLISQSLPGIVLLEVNDKGGQDQIFTNQQEFPAWGAL